MKLKEYDIFLLLGSLFIFSCGIGLWHDGKTIHQTRVPLALSVDVNAVPENSLQTMEMSNVLRYLQPLTSSRSVEKIIETMKGLTAKRAVDIAHVLINDAKGSLRLIDKKELLLGLALLYPEAADQDLILNLYVQDAQLHSGKPLLVIAAQELYRADVPIILAWAQRMQTTLPVVPQVIKRIVADAFSYAIKHNDTKLFARLVQAGVELDAPLATALLWQVVDKTKDAAVVPLLVAAGANLNEVKNKKTPLIQAVMNGNKDAVEALAKAGADVNLMPDKAVGTALQNALITRNVAIELILRNYNARE